MTASNIAVRPLRQGDQPNWDVLFREYIAHQGQAVTDTTIAATFDRLVAGADNMRALVAVNQTAGDHPLGAAHFVFHRSTWSPSWYCYLEDLFVGEDQRGQGIGRALINAVYAAADTHACTRTYWVAKTENAAARALYDDVADLAPFVQYRR